ncbi:MAG: hypothetical protein ACO3T6_02160 [Candidatus Nanopelagicaceae bacterium]|jgi:hypothetical protein
MRVMMSRAIEIYSETGRELPAHPFFFGALAFGILMLLLYLVLRLDKD